MKKYYSIFILIFIFASCKEDKLLPDRFRTGTFEIPAGDGFEKTTIIRQDSIQIEIYQTKIDSYIIKWKDSLNYTLKMIEPRTAIDEDIIHIRITELNPNSYKYESVIGNSSFIQKIEIKKIKD